MRAWRYDRGAIYTAAPFNVNKDGRRFVTVMLGYYLMPDVELGFDPSIVLQHHLAVPEYTGCC
jgi:hypothetical protein